MVLLNKPDKNKMKKLEKMDGKLFESLKPNEMSNLGAMVGGLCAQTSGTQKFQVGNTIYTKNYTDKQQGGIDANGKWYDIDCPYEYVYFKPTNAEDLKLADVRLTADLTIND